MTTSEWLSAITAFLTFLVACASLWAAKSAALSAQASKEAVIVQKDMMLLHFQPALSVEAVGGYIGKDDSGFPIIVFIRNTGGGVANLRAIDIKTDDINRADIGVPTIIEPNGKSNIEIWMKETNVKKRIPVAIYYWDVTNKLCYRTFIQMILQHTDRIPEVLEVLNQEVTLIGERDMQGEILHWRNSRLVYFDEGFKKRLCE